MLNLYLKRLLPVVIGLIVSLFASSQTSIYSFAASSGTYTQVSGSATAVPALLFDDVYSASIPIGFTFKFNGVDYTSFFANSNGFLTFSSTATATASQQRSNSAANIANIGPSVLPLWDDEIGYSAAPANSYAGYEVTGSAGSRVLTFEWRNWVWWYSSTNVAPSISFQVRLYETTNVIEFVYRQESNTALNGPSATIGIGSSTTDYLTLSASSANPTASSSTFNGTIASKPATDQVYTFTPPSACNTPTAQPTSLSLTPFSTSVSGSFTAASPVADRYLVVRTTTNTAPAPVDGTSYTVGTSVPLGGYVEVAGTATSFSSTSLTGGTNYYYWVFAYNSQCTGGPKYNVSSPLSGNVTTFATFTSIASGNWEDGSTWNQAGAVPTIGNDVIITGGYTVNVNAVTANAGTLTVNTGSTLSVTGSSLTVAAASVAGSVVTIASGGTVNVNGGTINVGTSSATNFFSGLSCTGTLTVSSGTVNIYGYLTFASLANFNQSGGNINVDGNKGGVTANSVAVGTALVTIAATTNVVWSGGTLTIVDPHTVAAGTSFSAATGGTKTITGGTLQIGDGTSTDASGAISNTTGFLVSSTMSVYNLTINNSVGATAPYTNATRMARLSSALTVLNQLSISANGYLFAGSSTTASTISFTGANLVNNGTLAGDLPGASANQFLGTLNFSNTAGTMTVSGAGRFQWLNTITLNGTATSHAANLTLSQTDTLVVVRVNLLTGTLTRNSQFSMGRATVAVAPTVQIGGQGTTVNGGSFDAIPIYVPPYSPTFLYSTQNGGPVMGSFNEMPAGPIVMNGFTLNDADGITVDRNVQVLSTLTMTLGNFNFGANNLTIGQSATTLGAVTNTSGLLNFTTGTMTRWFGTTSLPTTITNSNLGHFPIGFNGVNRNLWLSFSTTTALSTGGAITVSHTNAGGLTSITGFTDGAVTVDTRTNSSWAISQSGCVLTGTINARIQGTGLATVGAFANLRMIRATDAIGTSSNGTNSAADPQVNRTAMTLAMLANTFYIGAPSADLSNFYTSIASGAWENGSTWDIGSAPTSTSGVAIANGHTVTVNGATANGGNLTVNNGGVLTVSGSTLTTTTTLINNGTVNATGGTLTTTTSLTNNGTLNVNGGTLTTTTTLTNAAAGNMTVSSGTLNVTTTCTNTGNFTASGGVTNITGAATTGLTNSATTGVFALSGGTVNVGVGGNNRTFTNNGTLTVSSGTLNINGNASYSSGSTFNQSGGDINIDGNSGVVGTSVASGTAMLLISSALGTVTGGTITIVDPNFNASGKALDNSVSSTPMAWGTGHTLRIGNGISTDPSLNTSGFILEQYTSTGKLNLGNLRISGGNGTNRWASLGAWSTFVAGNLTVDANSEIRLNSSSTPPVFSGNIVNDGIITSTVNVSFAATTGNTSTITNTSAQIISGSGVFRNLAASPTANFTALTVNNSNAAGVTFGTGILTPTVSGAITVTEGKLNADALTLQGSSAQAVALTAATSSINVGNFTLNNSTGATLSGSGKLNVTGVVNITSGILASAGRLTLKSSLSGTARVASVASGAITGAVNVETYIPGGRRAFRFLGHPFSTTLNMSSLIDNIFITGGTGVLASVSGFDSTGSKSPSAYWFDNTATTPGAWAAFTSTADNSWTQYRGMRVLMRGDRTQTTTLTGANPTPLAVTLDVTGTLNTGAANISVPTAGAYHLVSNPYPSPTDIGTVIDATATIGTQYWVWDANAVTRGAYVTKTVGSGAYNLAMNGAFFVQPSAGTTLAFTEANKTATAPNLFRTNGTGKLLELEVQYNNYYADNIFVSLNKDAKATLDAKDGEKLINQDVNLYALSEDNKKLSLDARPMVDGSIIPLGFTTTIPSIYKVRVANYGLEAGTDVYLKDKFLNTMTLLTAATEYSFEVIAGNATTQGDNRFELVMKQAPVLVPIVTTFSVKLSPNPARDMVNVSFSNEEQANTTISITNAEGKTVRTVNAGNVQNGNISINVKGMAKGSYYVTLNNGKQKRTEKLQVQ